MESRETGTYAASSGRACGLELSTSVGVLFLVNDFAGRMASSVILPRIMRKLNERAILADKTSNVNKMGPVEKQHRTLSSYDPTSELILDYIELYVQWGYLTLFGASCPIVVLLAFATNFVETRTDGTKLFNDYRRVLPNRVDGIGEPLAIFYRILFIAVPINCGLIVFTFNAATFTPDRFVYGATHTRTSQTDTSRTLRVPGVSPQCLYALWHYDAATVPLLVGSSRYKIFALMAVAAFMLALIGQLDAIYPDVSTKTMVQVARQEVSNSAGHRRKGDYCTLSVKYRAEKETLGKKKK